MALFTPLACDCNRQQLKAFVLQRAPSSDEESEEQDDELALAMGFSGFGGK